MLYFLDIKGAMQPSTFDMKIKIFYL